MNPGKKLIVVSSGLLLLYLIVASTKDYPTYKEPDYFKKNETTPNQ